MSTGARRIACLLTIVAAMMTSLGCAVTGISIETVDVGELTKESRTVELGDADEVRVYVKMGAGELKIDRGAENLMDADFTYNVSDWKPEIEYTVSDGSGRLTVRQPGTDKISVRTDARYDWDLRFDEDVPLDMRIECGAGTSDIDLGELNVTQLDVKVGAGDAKIDLSGNQSLTRMNLDMGAGNVTVDLNGEWTDDVDVDIQGGFGNTTLKLPKDIGVRVNVTKGIGDVNVSGLFRRGDYYVNAAYDEADVVLEVNIQSVIGQIELDVPE